MWTRADKGEMFPVKSRFNLSTANSMKSIPELGLRSGSSVRSPRRIGPEPFTVDVPEADKRARCAAALTRNVEAPRGA